MALSLCTGGRPGAWLSFIRTLGGALETVGATDEVLAAAGASSAAIRVLRAAWPARSSQVLERCRRLGIDVAARGSPSYPESFLEITDSPLVVFWRGADPASCGPALAVVGARRCTPYGERTARQIGRDAAAAGIVVVSGLARGVDAAAHRGALESGRTAAVMAGGLDRIYPGEHRSLAERIATSGGFLLSEQPPGLASLPRLFPFRNRLITGLSLATVVVEAGVRSGSLASARHALDQSREVFAVPGPIDSPVSQGSNRLLAQGATPFCGIADLEAVDGFSKLMEKTTSNHSEYLAQKAADLDRESASILAAIHAGWATGDEIRSATALDGTRVLTLLTALELDGLVRRETHGRFRALVPRA